MLRIELVCHPVPGPVNPLPPRPLLQEHNLAVGPSMTEALERQNVRSFSIRTPLIASAQMFVKGGRYKRWMQFSVSNGERLANMHLCVGSSEGLTAYIIY